MDHRQDDHDLGCRRTISRRLVCLAHGGHQGDLRAALVHRLRVPLAGLRLLGGTHLLLNDFDLDFI